jgi:hypothetical protein
VPQYQNSGYLDCVTQVQNQNNVSANPNLKLSDPENLACLSPSELHIVPYLIVWTARHVSSVGADCLEVSRTDDRNNSFYCCTVHFDYT